MNFCNKYAPLLFDDIVWESPQTRRLIFDHYVTQKNIDPLLLYGPPGSGKTTIAKILPNAMWPGVDDIDIIELTADGTASSTKELTKALSTCEVMAASNDYRTIIVNDIELYNSKNTSSWRGTLDKYQDRVFFIFTTNEIESLDRAFRSRCNEFEIKHAPPDMWVPRITQILASENGASYTEEAVEQFVAKCGPDHRKILRSTGILVSQRKSLVVSPPESIASTEAG